MEKEGLACIFGIKKFHSYLFGHPFTIYTDNLPLKSLFCEKQAVPAQAAGRIQRWTLTFANYEYKILFCPTHKHSNADALSRLPSPTTSMEEPVPTELILLMEAMEKCQLLERVSRIGHRMIQPYLGSTSTYKMADQTSVHKS